MGQEQPSPEDPLTRIGFNAGQIRQDYRCELGVQIAALDELDAHREALRQIESGTHKVENDTRGRIAKLFAGLQKGYDKVRRIMNFKEHLAELFKRYEVDDKDLIEHIDRTHPCRNDLKKITNKLRALAKRQDEDTRRMRLLLHIALRLAGADHKIEKDEKQVLKGMLSDRRWKKRLQKEARRRAEMDREDGSSKAE